LYECIETNGKMHVSFASEIRASGCYLFHEVRSVLLNEKSIRNYLFETIISGWGMGEGEMEYTCMVFLLRKL